MKPLFKVLVPLLFFLGVGIFIGLRLLPDRIEVSKQLIIKEASPEQVHAYLQNPLDWTNWSAFSKTHDPSVIHLFGGPRTGTGARMQWSGDEVGNGHLILTQSISPAILTYAQLQAGDTDSTYGEFILSEVKGGTQVIWSQQMALSPTTLARLKGLYRKYKMEQQQEQGLSGLQTLLLENSKKRAENKPR